jgi:hypothetical protein
MRYPNLTAVLALLLVIHGATAATQTFTETTSGTDSWNTAGNWAAAIPSGGDDAVITGGDTAAITNAPAANYTGSLSLGANSVVQVRNRNAIAIVETPASITFNSSSTISILDGSPNFPTMALTGSGSVSLAGNGAHHETVSFGGAFTGDGALQLNGVNNDTFRFNAASTFSGGLTASSPANQGWRIEADASGCLGSGDVTIDAYVTLQIDAAEVIGNTATLTLNGTHDSRKASKLILNANETVGAFVIDGVDQCFGTFDSSTHPGIITGTGSLSIAIPPGDFDGDGDPNATDCAPCDSAVHSAALEICDGKDNDCDGTVDDGLVGCVNTIAASGTWDVGGNWSLGTMPTGGQSAVVNSGVTASVTTSPTFAYSGDLTLVGTAALRLQNSTAANAMGTGVKMNAGSSITVPQATGASNTTFPAIELLDAATFNAQSHHRTHTFPAVISGAGSLTITNINNTTIRITQANTFSGGLTMVNGSSRIEANADGALGTGDVNINDNTSLQIGSGLSSVIDDGAALNLNGNRDNRKAAKLILNSSETVDTFFIDGIQKTAGTYDSTSGLTDSGGNPLISGAGTLTVLSNPPAVAPVLVSVTDDVFGGPIYQNHPGINFVVTFDIDMDDSTVSAADFENAATATATIAIGAVSETAAGVFAVPVTITSPGTVILQIAAGAVLNSDLAVPLDTSSALPDDTTIAINAGNAPDTTITGTANGPGGSDDNWNNAANWDIGIPFGIQNVIIDTNAQVDTAPRDFTGNVTLNAGSTWRFVNANGLATVPSAPQTITLNAGAKINAFASVTFQTITLSGDAEIQAGASTTGHHGSRIFAGVISGSGKLTLGGVNNNTFQLDASNTHSGGVETRNVQNQRHRVQANANGATGTGDVIINDYASLVIAGALGDAIADSATLSVNGLKDSSSAAKLVLNSSETVKFLYIDGVPQAPGDYTSASGLTVGGDPFISGSGTLTVTGGATVVRIR